MSASSPGARTSWTARTTTAIDPVIDAYRYPMPRNLGILILGSLIAAAPAAGQGVREHTRLTPRGTTVTKSQAEALTLTVSAVSTRLIQSWVRTAGTIDGSGKVLDGSLSGSDAALVKVGQRVRA